MRHRTLIKLHGFTAVFFLPMAILYAVTGAIYILGQHGSYANEISVPVISDEQWPAREDAAILFVNKILQKKGFARINPFAHGGMLNNDTYRWLELDRRVLLTRNAQGMPQIVLQENNLLKRMVAIHRNLAGLLFAIIGVTFGIATMILVLSGAYMMLQMKLYRKSATLCLAAGTIMTVGAYIAS